MLKTDPIIQEYEQVLAGNKNEISVTRFFANHTDESQRMDAVKVFRFVCEEMLHWKPDIFRDYLTDEILEIYKLKPLMKRLHFPNELDPAVDLWYVAMLCYPQINDIDSDEDIIIRVFESVQKGRRERLPQDFFHGERGRMAALICLRYTILKRISYTNMESLYKKFAFPDSYLVNLLSEVRLDKPCKDFYKNDKLLFLHDALSLRKQQIDFLYFYYDFEVKMNAMKKPQRRESKRRKADE